MSAILHHPPTVRRHAFIRLPDFIPEGVRPPCRDVDPELFFPIVGEYSQEARDACHRCPVRNGCGEWATSAGVEFGLWGGLTPEQRAARRRIAAVTG